MNQRKYLKIAKHFVLIGPAGKQAGRLDQRDLALQIAAVEKTEEGHGGGVIALLLPKTKKQLTEIVKLRYRGYFVKEVKTRSSIRSEVREAAAEVSLIAQLANQFHDEKHNSPRAMRAPVKEFSLWMSKKIKEKDPCIVKLLSRSHPELLNRVGTDWWKVQIKLRRKKIKK